jgi:periplasmic copper chaperone A
MKPIQTTSVLLLVCITFFAAPPTLSKEFKAGAIMVSQPWTRATPKGARVAGGFMKIHNMGRQSDRLIGGTFDASKRIEIHEMTIINDIMKMRELPNGLEVKPGQSVELKPGSYHLMFMGLKRQLKKGETVDGTLTFKNAGKVRVTFTVESMGAKMKHGGHGKMKH